MRTKVVSAESRVPPVESMDEEALLARFGEKDRASFERQITAYETKLGPESARRWRHLVGVLMALTPAPAKLGPGHTMQFFIPDGKYRMQVFALHGSADGSFAVYAPDVLADSMLRGMIHKVDSPEQPNLYRLSNKTDLLVIDALDGKTANPESYYKDMTGWNRKAIRLTLPADASEAQISLVEQMCALASVQWHSVAE